MRQLYVLANIGHFDTRFNLASSGELGFEIRLITQTQAIVVCCDGTCWVLGLPNVRQG